jgi:hypothetical protein
VECGDGGVVEFTPLLLNYRVNQGVESTPWVNDAFDDTHHSLLLKKDLWYTLLNSQKPRVFCVARSSPCGAKFILCF